MDNTPDAGAEVRRLESLLDAARLLNATLELKELTEIILDVVRAEVPVDRISVFVVDRGRNTLHSLVARKSKILKSRCPWAPEQPEQWQRRARSWISPMLTPIPGLNRASIKFSSTVRETFSPCPSITAKV